MKLRKKFFPRSLLDIGSFFLVVVMVPIVFLFEMIIILPYFHAVGSLWFYVHVCLGSFVFFNVMSNFVFIMIADTGVDGEVTTAKSSSPRWNYCKECNTHIPPRAWHCRDCNVCILKRDHHCQFSGCCVGHRNHRYFYFFVVYMAVGGLYCLAYHTRFIIHSGVSYMATRPQHEPYLLSLAIAASYSIQQGFITLYGAIVIATGATVGFSVYYWSAISRGQVLYEKARDIHDYDAGSVRRNVEQVLGRRWYLAWVSPLVPSELPTDGYNWVRANTEKRDV